MLQIEKESIVNNLVQKHAQEKNEACVHRMAQVAVASIAIATGVSRRLNLEQCL